jgi:hypothetical protein
MSADSNELLTVELNEPASAGAQAESATNAEFDLERTLAELDHCERTLPRDAILAAREHREEITPRLIEAIRSATAQAREGHPPKGSLHIFSLYLLAEFKAREALPAILETIALPQGLLNELWGDCLHEDLSRMLAVLGNGDVELVQSLIRNRDLDMYVRWKAVDMYPLLVRDGIIDRAAAVELLTQNLRDAIAGADDDITGPLICTLCDLGAAPALPEIEEVYRRGLIDDSIITLRNVQNDIAAGDAQVAQAHKRLEPTAIDDVIAELEGWAWFAEDDDDSELYDEDQGEDIKVWREQWQQRRLDAVLGNQTPMDSTWQPILPLPEDEPRPVESRATRVGRNDPCPCRSGKKYKKCCGGRH